MRPDLQARPAALRFAIAAVLVALVVGSWLGLRHGVVIPTFGRTPAGDVLSIVAPALLTMIAAPLVGYRRRDALLWVIPPLGLALAARLAWRIALLPRRDWVDRSAG
ncbi:hypothetical protein ABZS66_58660 [Dactylosporangium sp. NPDC005572]|uniref:hypothetical protein n=1 Tax=Dactylosporangium sp. NPDC005572 TaxID=3156889 RepID=UPI0033A18641